jgi:citronellol/citronellal dehydrogenase
MASLAGKTLFITGASRGIGLAIALRAARDGANVAVAAKTSEPHPKLAGTIYTAAAAVEAAGGKALPLVMDLRFEEQIAHAVDETVRRFGGIDILINNASAISLTGTLETPAKRFDLMMGVNVRGTFLASQHSLPHLVNASHPHILVLAPPPSFEAKWFAPHLAYSIAKYGMSMCVLGLAEEFRAAGVAVNALWPRTAIATAALSMIPGADPSHARTPEIVADAAWHILTQNEPFVSGQFFTDEQVLRSAGMREFSTYAVDPGAVLQADFFL